MITIFPMQGYTNDNSTGHFLHPPYPSPMYLYSVGQSASIEWSPSAVKANVRAWPQTRSEQQLRTELEKLLQQHCLTWEGILLVLKVIDQKVTLACYPSESDIGLT